MTVTAAQSAVEGALELGEQISEGCQTAAVRGAPATLGMIFLNDTLAGIDITDTYPPGSSPYTSLGGLHVGSTNADVVATFPGRTAPSAWPGQPEGIVVSPPEPSAHLLLFKPGGISAGLPDALALPEGCS
jgi:hypothetical protein